MFFYYFLSLFTKNYFLIDAINLATWGPLYTCLVSLFFRIDIYITFNMTLKSNLRFVQCNWYMHEIVIFQKLALDYSVTMYGMLLKGFSIAIFAYLKFLEGKLLNFLFKDVMIYSLSLPDWTSNIIEFYHN